MSRLRLLPRAAARSRSARSSHYLTIEPLESRIAPATFTVDSFKDVADPGHITLRDAINMSNATPGPNTINFAIPSTGVEQTITLGSPLPALTQPVSIFGGSQTFTTYTTPGIILDGSGAGTGNGFTVTAGNCTIEGFVIEFFTGHGVLLQTNGHDEVINDCIGTNAAHNAAAPNTLDGVQINNVANNAVQNCIISGNDHNGVELTGANAINNLIGTGATANANVGIANGGGNYIGADYDATGAIPNQLDGILINGSAHITTIKANVISGNIKNGVEINGSGSTGNILTANMIGVSGNGKAALPNKLDGILITSAPNNTIGGLAAASLNVISGNLQNGIDIVGKLTTKTMVLGNYIGTDITGAKAIANKMDGILINGSGSNSIGSSVAGATNLISGNTTNGIQISGVNSKANTIVYNDIGTDATGKLAIANGNDGVLVDTGATGNFIGGTMKGFQNVISGNTVNGVEINGASTSSNTIRNDLIGVTANGLTALPNLMNGVMINNAPTNTIGGTSQPLGNVISGNGVNGIDITGANARSTTVAGNLIGTDVSGAKALANVGDGILIESGASNNIIGVAGSAAAINVISGNGKNGIEINGAATTGNDVQNSYIGTDIKGLAALPNGNDGILIMGAPNATIGGTATTPNTVVSGNTANGIEISGSGATKATIQRVLIGTDSTGNAALGNANEGILINDAPNAAIQSSTISGNGANGVHIMGSNATGNTMDGCIIGLQADGSAALANANDGVFIENSANGNTVGATTLQNTIAGNGANGVEIDGAGTTNNTVENSLIGINSSDTAIANANDGVLIGGGATGNFVGTGDTVNVISGNTVNGVEITDSGTDGNFVQGNYIGSDSAGTTAVPNGQHGVMISTAASDNLVGGAAPGPGQGLGNLISGNTMNGVDIEGDMTMGNMVQGNNIGAQSDGKTALPNMNDGVFIGDGAASNSIGLAGVGTHNLISGNAVNGVEINGSDTKSNIVQNNIIGLGVTSFALANKKDGVLVTGGANNNQIGKIGATLDNIISGNGANGVELNGVGTKSNDVQNNVIGLNPAASIIVANKGDGVLVTSGAQTNFIGLLGGGNVIGGNTKNGVEFNGAGTTGNSLTANKIGTNGNDSSGLGNKLDGVLVNGAKSNRLGTAVSSGGNVISGNGFVGVLIEGGGSGNVIQNNHIGSNAAGTKPLKNAGNGILITGSNNNTTGGVIANAGNVIAFNGINGVAIVNGTGDRIAENSIFLNTRLGIDLDNNGVTKNKAGGPHTGANHDQNFPVIVSAVANGSSGTTVKFTLNGTPNDTFTIEFFDNPAADPSGYGEGRTFLKSFVVTTNAAGNVTDTINLTGAAAGTFLTATATDTKLHPNDTSEFSLAVKVT